MAKGINWSLAKWRSELTFRMPDLRVNKKDGSKALEEVTNDEKGYRKLCKWLKKFKLETEQLLVVMEYTGIYTYGLERYLHKEGIAFVKRPALDIKRSPGMIRGKTDRADARFISRYNLVVLQNLMTYRDKMVVDRASYQARIKEL
jgi:transposase